MSKKSALIIKSFLEENRITISEFARVTETSRFSIYKYLSGAPIHPKKAKSIEEKVLKQYRIFLPYEKLID